MEQLAEYTSTPESSAPCTPSKRKHDEMEDLDEADADDPGSPDAAREPRLYHFKALFDQLWDYPAICKKFFLADKPYLAVKEHPTTNAHVHFQGYSRAGEHTFNKMRNRLGNTHHLKKENPNTRPTSMAKRTVNDVGFQYMCKDLTAPPLAVNMFTPEDLVTMKAHSTMRIKELKYNVSEYIASIPEAECRQMFRDPEMDAEAMINTVANTLFKHQKEGKLVLPKISRHTRDSIKNGILAIPKLNDKLKARIYVSK